MSSYFNDMADLGGILYFESVSKFLVRMLPEAKSAKSSYVKSSVIVDYEINEFLKYMKAIHHPHHPSLLSNHHFN